MATNKTVTVTVLPTLTGDTVASYNVYEGVSGTTLLGTMTPAEAAAGKVFAFTDGIVHSVKVQTVWTTAGASSIRSAGVELDLSTPTNYALQFLQAQTDRVIVPVNNVNGVDFFFDIRMKCTALSTDSPGSSFMGSNAAPKFYFGISNTEVYNVVHGTGAAINGSVFSINTWYTMRIKLPASGLWKEVYWTTNETINEGTDLLSSISGTDLSITETFLVDIGKWSSANVNGDWEIDWVDANGIVYNFDAIVGGQVLDSNGLNPLTITTDRADVNDMLVAVV